MIVFFYIGIIVGVLLGGFNYFISNNKLMKKARRQNVNVTEGMIKNMFKFIAIACSTIAFFCIVMPFIIWNTGAKDIGEADRVLEYYEISILPNTDGKTYIGEAAKSDELYVINLGTEKKSNFKSIEKKTAEIIVTGKNKTSEYQRVSKYKIKKLIADNWLTRATNDIYANIYYQQLDAQYIGTIEKIYVSNKEMAEKYEYQIP